MDNEFVLDIQEIMDSVESAPVISILFPTFRKAVVIDTRSTRIEGPLVCIAPMVASAQERIRSIGRMRPGLPAVSSLAVVAWPRYVDSLVALGVWGRIVKRFSDSGHEDAAAACDVVLDELRRLEKAELRAVVVGDSYRTIWSAQ